MKKELNAIIRELENTLDGEPWFGRAVYKLLREVDPEKAFIKPNETEHSMVELLYHMITWTDFTLKRIENDKINDMAAFEKIDWREIDPSIHGWEEGLSEFIAVNQHIIALLKEKNDEFLGETVDYREYNFRFLLRGIIQHHIYHAGQIAYLVKLLK